MVLVVNLEVFVGLRFSVRVRRRRDKEGGECVDYCTRAQKFGSGVWFWRVWRLRSDRPRRPGSKWLESTMLGLDSKGPKRNGIHELVH